MTDKKLDYTSGVVPILKVDRALDQLRRGADDKKLNGVAVGAFAKYDADQMHGLPVGVQVIGRRLEEEKILGFMGLLEDSLTKVGKKYEGLEVSS